MTTSSNGSRKPMGPLFFFVCLVGLGIGASGCGTDRKAGSTDAPLESQPDELGLSTQAHITQNNPYPDRFPTISPIDWDAFPALLTKDSRPSGRAWIVSTDGDDGADGTPAQPLRTIDHALSKATDGDWVVVRGGTYLESPPGEFIALRMGESSSGVTLTAWGDEKVIVQPGHDGINRGLAVYGDRIVVHGLSFEGFSRVGITIGAQGETVEDLVLSRISVSMRAEGFVDGIAIIPDNGDGPPVIDGFLAHDVRVVGASIGLQCNSGPCHNMRLQGVYVQNKTGDGSGADAIAVENGDNIVVLDTEVTGAGADGIDLKATRVAVFNTFVHDVARNGIKLWRGGDIVNSVVTHTGADASVVFEEPGDYRLMNTVVAHHNYKGPTSYAVTVGYGQDKPFDVQLINTVFTRNSGGVFLSPLVRATIQSCVFGDVGNGVAVDVRSNKTGEPVRILTNDPAARFAEHGLGKGNLLGIDPGFRDSKGQDYRLAPGSRLIDSGAGQRALPQL